MVVVTSEGLGWVDDREGRSASGDCEGDSNKYEDFSHGRILSKKYLQLYHTLAKRCDGNDKKLGLWPAAVPARQIDEDAVGHAICPVMFVHAFCTHIPCFRMKSPHRSHIVSKALFVGDCRVLRSAVMSDHAFDFLQSWIAENVNPTTYEDEDTAEHLTQDCVWEAQTRGITKADLIEAAGAIWTHTYSQSWTAQLTTSSSISRTA